MNFRTVFKLIGVLIFFIGLSMSFSLFWSLYLGESDSEAILISIGICLFSGGVLYAVGWNSEAPVLRREGMAVVGLGWLLAAFFGALPFYFSGAIPHFVDAYFEAMSGFTTTGSTILTDIEVLPKGVLFWRSFTQWLGGMGIVVLFVAIFPYLKAGGKQLFRSEVPGPTAEILRPRINETAALLWKIYLGLSGLQAGLLTLLGMTPFDALCHTFSTMATGGFSTKNASIGSYNSVAIDLSILAFMLLSATNFGFYFQLLKGKGRDLIRDSEWRFFLGLVILSVFLIASNLWLEGVYSNSLDALRYASFQGVSVLTTTGYGTANFEEWPSFTKLILVGLMFVGGCAGSTGGGMKVIRIQLILKNVFNGIEKVFHPHLVRTLKIGGLPVEDDIRNSIVVFFCSFLIILFFCSLAIAAMGVDILTAITSVVTTMNNVGPGLGRVGPMKNFALFPSEGKVLLSLCMCLGRLELFAVLVLFLPSFWRGR